METLKKYYENNNNNIYAEKINEFILRFSKHLVDLENNTIKVENESILDEIKLEESKINICDETCKKSCDKKTCNTFTDMFINIRNNVISIFMSIYNHIFVY